MVDTNSETSGERVVLFFQWLGNPEQQRFIYAPDNNTGASRSGAATGILNGLASVKIVPARYELLAGKFLSKSTTFGIRDVTAGRKGWVLRVDNPHVGQEVNHLNINPKFTGVKDPHMSLPPGSATVGGAATKFISVAGKAALVAAVAVDTVRVVSSARQDLKENDTLSYRTAKTSASVASGWTGGIAGAIAGNSLGTVVGSSIGALFGGVGAVPGAAIGSIVGGLIGGITGGMGSSAAAEAIVDTIRGDIRGVIFITNKGHIVVKPSFTPENKEHEDQWLEVLQIVVSLVLHSRQVCIITLQPLNEVFDKEAAELLEQPGNFKVNANSGIFFSSLQTGLSEAILEKACATPHFFFSAMVFATCKPERSELKMLKGCVQTNIPVVGGEYICMNTDGNALYWLNPQDSCKIRFIETAQLMEKTFKFSEKKL